MTELGGGVLVFKFVVSFKNLATKDISVSFDGDNDRVYYLLPNS